MLVNTKKNCEPFDSGRGEVVYELISAATGAQNHSVAHVELLPGKSSLKHLHPEVEESYYILQGTPELVVNENKQQLQPGDSVVIPPHSMHQIFNNTDQTVHFLAICAPGWTPDCSVFEN